MMGGKPGQKMSGLSKQRASDRRKMSIFNQCLATGENLASQNGEVNLTINT